MIVNYISIIPLRPNLKCIGLFHGDENKDIDTYYKNQTSGASNIVEQADNSKWIEHYEEYEREIAALESLPIIINLNPYQSRGK